MKRTLIMLASAGLLLAGCSSGDTEASPAVDTSSPASASSSAIAAPDLSPRGNRVKTFTDDAGLGCASEPCDVEFTLSAPTPATECTSEYAPEFGTILAFPVRVETRHGADLTPYAGMWNPYSFSAVVESGVTKSAITSAAAYSCAESDRAIPNSLSPASVYEGFVVLDVPTDASTLLFLPSVTRDGSGWEWEL